MKSVGLLVVAIALLFFTSTALADRTIWYVHPDSSLNTIQAGLDSCADNDIVLVALGMYVENILWPNTQGIHLISELGPEITIIDGDATSMVILIDIAVDTTTIINGFTIQNGVHIGGGIKCLNYASPTITGNTITNNHGNVRGGAIFCGHGCSAIISNNTITYNYVGGPISGSGGGIRCDSNQAKILDNMITNNRAVNSWGGAGGGISCWHYDGIISGNTITGNEAAYGGEGGGIYCRFSSPTIADNSVSGNIAWHGGGIFCEGSSPIINGCVISNNSNEGVYCEPDFYGNPSDPVISSNDIYDNVGYGIHNVATNIVSADSNWWGHATGPYHPATNPGGLGDTVSDYVDYDPWLTGPGIEEQPTIKPIVTQKNLQATIFRGPLQLPKEKKCRVFDITGRVVEPSKIQPGIYFIEVDGVVTEKVVKVR